MKNKLGALIAFMAFASGALVSDNSFAEEGLILGTPVYGGNGCPAGSASATLSPDQQSVSILFDSYQIEAGGITGKRMDRKSCNIAIPVHVPQGWSISIVEVDYRGFNSLPPGAYSQFNVEYFFAGGIGPRYSKRFYGSIDQDFLLNNTLQATAFVWSACGAETNLRINSNMMVMTNRFGEQALSSVDSIDLKSGIVYHLQWKRCTGSKYDDFEYRYYDRQFF